MSGSLANALIGAQALSPTASTQPIPSNAGVLSAVPLGSLPPALGLRAPNAAALQSANPSMPWYQVPGMFQQPPVAVPGVAAQAPGAAPAIDPATQAQLAQLANNQNQGGGSM